MDGGPRRHRNDDGLGPSTKVSEVRFLSWPFEIALAIACPPFGRWQRIELVRCTTQAACIFRAMSEHSSRGGRQAAYRRSHERWRNAPDDTFAHAVRCSHLAAGVLRSLGFDLSGGNYQAVRRRLTRLNLDTTRWHRGRPPAGRPLGPVLVSAGNTNGHRLGSKFTSITPPLESRGRPRTGPAFRPRDAARHDSGRATCRCRRAPCRRRSFPWRAG